MKTGKAIWILLPAIFIVAIIGLLTLSIQSSSYYYAPYSNASVAQQYNSSVIPYPYSNYTGTIIIYPYGDNSSAVVPTTINSTNSTNSTNSSVISPQVNAPGAVSNVSSGVIETTQWEPIGSASYNGVIVKFAACKIAENNPTFGPLYYIQTIESVSKTAGDIGYLATISDGPKSPPGNADWGYWDGNSWWYGVQSINFYVSQLRTNYLTFSFIYTPKGVGKTAAIIAASTVWNCIPSGAH